MIRKTHVPNFFARFTSMVTAFFLLIMTGLIMSQGALAAQKGPDISLISASALASRMTAETIILDARPPALYQDKHIPGSFSFSWEKYTRTDNKGIPYRIFPPEELSAIFGKMGMNDHSDVVIYGDADKSWGGEGWAAWTLSWIGHKGKILILDGGMQEWMAAGLPMEQGNSSKPVKPVSYKVQLRDNLIVTTDMIRKNPSAFQLVDTRSTVEWLKIRMPGAKRIEWTHFYSGSSKKPIPQETLKKLLTDKGIDPGKPVVYFCAGGIRSGYAWIVHQLAGLPSAMNYEEGMAAWERLPLK